MEDRDKYNESDIRVKSPFFEKLDNFWFYHKVHIIVGLFVAVVITVCMVQCCSKADVDVKVMYAGEYPLTYEESLGIQGDLNAVMPKDFDKNGEKYSELVRYHVVTAEWIKEKEEEIRNLPDEERYQYQVDRNYFSTEKQNFNNYIMVGECGVFLLDMPTYYELASRGILRPLVDVFGEIPDTAVGEYGIKLSQTALYKYSNYLSVLPEDTVLCLSRKMMLGSSSDAELYSRMTEMFVAMAQE